MVTERDNLDQFGVHPSGFAPHEEHGSTFTNVNQNVNTEITHSSKLPVEDLPDDSNFVHITPVVVPENLHSTTLTSLTRINVNNDKIDFNSIDSSKTASTEHEKGENSFKSKENTVLGSNYYKPETTIISDSSASSSSSFTNDAVSWIIAIGVLGCKLFYKKFLKFI